jgi:hypothetical protein
VAAPAHPAIETVTLGGATRQTSRTFFVRLAATAVPVTGRGGLQGWEMLRIPHCLDNRLRDGGKAVSPTHQPRSTPQGH